MAPAISVLIPARNEEKLLPFCLESIRRSEKLLGEPVEIIVALNRCTDRTEEIAVAYGARIAREDAKNLSKIRNAAARLARGEIIVTIDADCIMTVNMLPEVRRRLLDEKTVGGAVRLLPERRSVPILITLVLINALVLVLGVSAGLFWCRKKDFETLGGFDEKLTVAEDLDFALRLRALGRRSGRRFRVIRCAHVVASMRKGETFGDWYYLNPYRMWRIAVENPEEIDRHWYEIQR